MTKYLEANFLPWLKNDQFRTKFVSGPVSTRFLDFDLNFEGAANQPSQGNIGNLIQMPVAGSVVGIIVHVRNTDSGPPNDDVFTAVKGTSGTGQEPQGNFFPGSQLTFVDLPVKATCIAGQTGFFFSDPNIAEFSRSFALDDYIGIQRQPANVFTGIFQVSIMMAIDLKTPAVLPP
jgi:hypothetical protein